VRVRDCVRFFLKNTIYKRQEKQNTEDTVEKLFSAIKNFVKDAKFFWNDILKKKHAYQFGWTNHKKMFNPIGPAVLRNKKNVWMI
jgi:hypothetical protein